MSKKLQVLDQVHFKKIYNDWISQHLYFFCIFEKNYNDWIKSFSKSKWTGLNLLQLGFSVFSSLVFASL